VTYHRPLHQLDIKNAFLNDILDEEVYMEQSPSFVAQRVCEEGLQAEEVTQACRLKKSLYGLKQSPRALFGRFASVIQEFGFCRTEKNHSVFWRI